MDKETGLYYYGRRYYDSSIGRFITADPTIQRPDDPQDLNRYAYCRNNPVSLIDPTGLGWKKFWGKVKNFMEDYGNFISPLGRAIVTGDWKSFGMIAAATVAAVASYGILAAFTPMVMTANTASVIALSAASTSASLDTKPGGYLINQVSTQICDDMLGMRPDTARIWGSVLTYMAVNAGFQSFYGNMLTGGEKLASKGYEFGKDKALDVEVQKVLDTGKGFNYGGVPKTTEQVSRVLFNKGGDLVGVASKSSILMLGSQHTGIVMGSIPSLSESVRLVGVPGVNLYGLWGISHQAVNVSLLEAGYASTVMSVGGGWTTILSTVVYGPYGCGAAAAAAASQELSQ